MYDFSIAQGMAYGYGQKHLPGFPDRYGMYAGDTNADGTIDVADKNIWNNQVGGRGYFQSDSNLDGQGNNIDKNDTFFPNIGANCFIP